MGFHICVTNSNAFPISVSEGVYGNVMNAKESRDTIWGKIRDLYAVKPGDLILLYVKNPELCFHGVYEVTSLPYICFDDLFNDPDEKYSLRFDFKIKYYFPNPVPSFEFYSLIERGKINSTVTLSRDINSSYRGIRQLFESEFQEILHLFYKYNPKTNPSDFSIEPNEERRLNSIEAVELDPATIESITLPTTITFNRIPAVRGKAILENVLHTYIVYNVLHNRNNVKEDLGLINFNELILEAPVFKSMQFRSDILATYKHEEKVFYYSFYELKKDKRVGIEEISQLIGYLKSFAAAKSLEINSYEGVYISSSFKEDLIDYLTKRKTVERENIISLISYKVDNEGKVLLTKEI